ncbi:MAG: hypothetical protein SO314_02260 [Alphaproteobacteria bacterium]|nr:hypothetical protein [Alphaproteobacteria bacterium]
MKILGRGIGKAEEILAKEGGRSGEKMGISRMGEGKRGEGKRVGEKREGAAEEGGKNGG